MLQLKKRKDSKHWQITGSINGNFIRQSSGRENKKEAEQVLKQLENLYYDKLAGVKKHWPTLLEASEDYINHKNLHIHYITQISKVMKKFGHVFIDSVQPDFSNHIKKCLSPGIKNSSVNRVINDIQAMINLQMKKLGKQPIKLDKFTTTETKISWHNPTEYQKLLEHSGKLQPLICFLYYTGCRISEAINLQWPDIDYEENLISVYMSKTKRYKYIYIHPELKKQLGKHQGSGKVFHYSSRFGIRTSWKKMEKNSGVKSHPHKFRHTFATRVLKNSDISTLMSLGGWSSEKMALRYAKVVDTRKADAIKKL
jgi:integrase